jgi:hypothetical protein
MKIDHHILQDSRSGLYYNRDLGGFSEAEASKATRFENAAQVAFIQAHFARPEFIVAVPAIDAPPSPENAGSNPHLNGTARIIRHPQRRWDEKRYTFGEWSIRCYLWNQNKGAHPYLRSTRRDYVPLWEAYRADTKEGFFCVDGGIKKAVRFLTRHEMKRHGIVS